MDYLQWKHVFKLDPAKEISDEALELLCESGTDAILVGGSDNVTEDGVIDLLVRVRRFTLPIVLEVSDKNAVIPAYDFYFVPTVLNSQDTKWIFGAQHEAIKEHGDFINWDEMVAEGYCILNADCKAAQLTSAKTDLTEEDVVAYARMAEHIYKLPIFYMEYSGTYGNVEIVRAAKAELDRTKLYYGGGITSAAQAQEMAQVADTVVVGNIIYEDLKAALQTVKAVKNEL